MEQQIPTSIMDISVNISVAGSLIRGKIPMSLNYILNYIECESSKRIRGPGNTKKLFNHAQIKVSYIRISFMFSIQNGIHI